MLDAGGSTLKGALAAPSSQRWWPGELHEEVYVVLSKVAGDEAVERVGQVTVRNSVGPIVMPVVRVTLALLGSTPGSLLARANQLVTSSVRGLTVSWAPDGPTAGAVEARYGQAVPPAYVPLWRGMMRYVFEITETTGTVTDTQLTADRQAVYLRLSWA